MGGIGDVDGKEDGGGVGGWGGMEMMFLDIWGYVICVIDYII
jgi:hypothetical protein